MQVYATEFTTGLMKKNPLYERLNCDKVNSLSISDHAVCWGIIKV